jgi:hypothetical protein
VGEERCQGAGVPGTETGALWHDRAMGAWYLDRLEGATDAVLAALRAAAPLDPFALRFLVRRYRATARADIAEALGAPLAARLAEPVHDMTSAGRAAWLVALADAVAVSDDARLLEAVSELVAEVRPSMAVRPVEDASAAIDAVLRTAPLLPAAVRSESLAGAIEALEALVARAYRAGRGLADEVAAGDRTRGTPAGQIQAASALMSAFAATTRLPYAMLADELMHVALGGRESAGATVDGVHVCCALAQLHADDGFRSIAVISGRDYARLAERLVASMWQAAEPSRFGLALADWLALQNLH